MRGFLKNPILPGSEFGYYYGPGVYGKVSVFKLWEALKIEKTASDVTKQLRVCERENMDNTFEVCETFGIGEISNLDDCKFFFII